MKLHGLVCFILLWILAGCPTPAPVPPDSPDSPPDVVSPPPDPPAVADASPAPAIVDAAPVAVKDSAPPARDAAPAGDIFDKACENLRTLKCKEGFSAAPQDSCDVAMRHGQKIANMKPDCVAAAGSVAAAKKCGSYCKHLQP